MSMARLTDRLADTVGSGKIDQPSLDHSRVEDRDLAVSRFRALGRRYGIADDLIRLDCRRSGSCKTAFIRVREHQRILQREVLTETVGKDIRRI